jgi:hypothetical protein
MSDQEIVVTRNHRPCPNCDSDLLGDYCSNCGQHDQDMRRPFFKLIGEFFSSLTELDGRFYRSIFYLFTKPGFLSTEFVNGRRASYTPPLRLFLIISISFFLMVSVLNSIDSVQNTLAESQSNGASTVASSLIPDLNIQVTDGNEDVVVTDLDDLTELLAGEEVSGAEGELDNVDIEEGVTDDDLEDVYAFIDSFNLGFLSEQTNENLRIVIKAQTKANVSQFADDPQEFFFGSLEYINFFILMMIPVLALIQKVFYIGTGRYYAEHIILALHNHAFLILSFFLIMLTDMIAELEVVYLSSGFDLAGLALIVWLNAYLFLSLKNFFKQGKLFTLLKFVLASFLYMFCLSFGILSFGVLLFFTM